PTLYVLDTISPDDSAIRQWYMFQQGDEYQDDVLYWLRENWRISRESHIDASNKPLGAKWNVALHHLGDWHKQPGFMIAPSGGDLITALNWIDEPDNVLGFLLAPIVTLGHPHIIASSSMKSNFLMVPQSDGTALRIDFWYIDNKARVFLPIMPTIYPDEQLPSLVAYPWHILDERRLTVETRQLEDDDLFVSVTIWNADAKTPLETCFLIARTGAARMLILITSANYPYTSPQARLTPSIHIQPEDDMYEVFANAWAQSEAISYQPEWTPESTLLDYVHALEEHLGFAKSAASSEETP
ncbi:MAG: hypothetical protein ABI835_08115, partial [Chloroflexota bacterium]